MNTLDHDRIDLEQAPIGARRLAQRVRRMIGEARALAYVASDALRAASERRRLHRQLRRQARALSQLDARTLQDIGLHHSEIGSIMSELAERADPTRRRVGHDKVDSVSPIY